MDRPNFLYRHPWGTVAGVFSERGLRSLDLPRIEDTSEPETAPLPPTARPWAEALRRALDRYFAGEREDFNDIPLDLDGATPFRRKVWETARHVPWGETTSYGGLAERMGRDRSAARAVGQALGSNPIPIIVPCHRFLAGDGSLGGFSCGLHWKEELLNLEGTAPRAVEKQGCLAL